MIPIQLQPIQNHQEMRMRAMSTSTSSTTQTSTTCSTVLLQHCSEGACCSRHALICRPLSQHWATCLFLCDSAQTARCFGFSNRTVLYRRTHVQEAPQDLALPLSFDVQFWGENVRVTHDNLICHNSVTKTGVKIVLPWMICFASMQGIPTFTRRELDKLNLHSSQSGCTQFARVFFLWIKRLFGCVFHHSHFCAAESNSLVIAWAKFVCSISKIQIGWFTLLTHSKWLFKLGSANAQ